MTRKTLNGVLVLVGIAAVVAFFLPFLDVGGLVQASGWDVLVGEGVPWTMRLALLGVPFGGVAMIASGATNYRGARWVGLGFGLSVFGYLGFQMVRLFIATTGWGLWITLAAAATAAVVAVVAKSSSER